MTQAELDALMAGDLEDDTVLLMDEISEKEPKLGEISLDHDFDISQFDLNGTWPPPPPIHEYKVVDQLDNVTKDSEVKAGEVFDILETISGSLVDIETACSGVVQATQNNIQLFEKLSHKFPNIQDFQIALAQNLEANGEIEHILQKSQTSNDDIMMIMDIMQYQDIHRQKIERVINVMRALSRYMNSLFDSDVEDNKRVKAPIHIQGDTLASVSEDEIEALLESFGKK